MSKIIIILRGPTAGGKSTIARLLSKNLDFPVIELDSLKKEIDGTVHIGDYDKQKNWFIVAGQRAKEQLKSKKGVILDEAYRDCLFINLTLNQITLEDVKSFVIQIKYSLSDHEKRHQQKDPKTRGDLVKVERLYQEYEKYDLKNPYPNDLEINNPNLSAEEIISHIAREIGKYKTN